MHRDNETQMVHLPSFMQRWSAATITVSVGPDKAVFRWPRSGARIVVSATRLYDVLA